VGWPAFAALAKQGGRFIAPTPGDQAHPRQAARAAGGHATGEQLCRQSAPLDSVARGATSSRIRTCGGDRLLLARAIHRGEAPLAARLEQARETTMANTLAAAPRPSSSIRACCVICASGAAAS